jgi:4-amino-4-deoxy-L-arabinose transferase-like glycosyltransferase
VTTATDIAPPKKENRLAARIGWAALIVATLYVCYFSHLGAIGFVGPDEPRYAWVARDMAETGDWVTPRLYGKPWFEKPPLYYWGAAICFKLFGVSEAAARLPSAISALLATLAMAWLAWRVYGAETARWLLLLLPTTVGMIGFSHAAATDMPFTAMLTIAMVCAAVLVRLPLECGGLPRVSPNEGSATESRGTLAAAPASSSFISFGAFTPSTPFASLLFGFFLGLAVLAKGPAAMILCGGAVFLWAIFTKHWRDALRLFHPAAIASFCVTALPWYILCARRNPDFFRIFIIEHNFKRYLTPEFQHIQPFWFYLPILLAAFLPWTVGILAALVDSRSRSPLNGFFLSFGLFPVLFFTISRSKLPGYILPAVPPLAWLLVNTTSALVAKRRDKRLLAATFAITSVLVAIAVERFAAHRALGTDIIPAPWTTNVWFPLLIAGILGGILALLRRPVTCLGALQLGILLATWNLSSGLASVDPQFSARGVITASHTDVQSLTFADVLVYDVPRGIHYGLNFYVRREIPEWTSGTRGVVFSSWKGQSKLQDEGYACQQHLVFPAAVLCRGPGALPAYASSGRKSQ